MARILGLDVGTRRIGVALSDPEGQLATGLRVLDARKCNAIDAIGELATLHDVEEAVVGLPCRADGTEGESARLARDFGSALQRRTGLHVTYVDESYTTVTADEALSEGRVPWEKRRQVRDKIAAQLILQSYLDGARR